MGENAPGYQPGSAGLDIYWRRRAIALAIGLALFGVVAWAVNGTFGVPTAAPTSSLTKNAAHGGSAGGGQGGGGAAGATASRPPAAGRGSKGSTVKSSAVKGRPAKSGHASHRHDSGSAHGHSSSVGRAWAGTHQSGWGHGSALHLATCPAGKVILGLRQPHASYPRHTWPRFAAYVVSTAARPCRFGIGARSVGVTIRSAGRPLWNSSACVTGHGTKSAVLTKGVPAVLHFRWDRRVQRPGCRGQGRLVRPGTFVATAVSGRLFSKPLIFVLTAPGVAVP